MNMEELRELADLIDERGFTDFEFENEEIRVRISKQPAAQVVQTAPAVQAVPAAASETKPVVAEKVAEAQETAGGESDADDGLLKIESPIVGTFYRAPGPDKDPYVKEGDQVTPDSVVCIVEAMKLMNEIQAETSGEIAKIYVENGQPVEYGQPLFGIKS
ncbi:MAG: acetyl-CoA carboxylase biotin carboxyl carrier protein [Pyrinomonadaceae bacterium]|nr:acetyl-CoA carboxylase biotin carboxyl carrier protein [Pyrinomonadaceae bacterium]